MNSVYGIVRADLASNVDAATAGIRALARLHRMRVVDIVVRDGATVGRALAQMPDAVDVEVVPSQAHLGALIGAARRRAAVWVVDSGVCWPLHGGRAYRIPRPDLAEDAR